MLIRALMITIMKRQVVSVCVTMPFLNGKDQPPLHYPSLQKLKFNYRVVMASGYVIRINHYYTPVDSLTVTSSLAVEKFIVLHGMDQPPHHYPSSSSTKNYQEKNN